MTSQPLDERILITGGAGYIGSVAAHILASQGIEITVIDDCSTGHLDAVPISARFIQASLHDRPAIREALENCTAVIHFAGKSLVSESVTNPDLYRLANVEGSQNLLDEMHDAGITRLVFSSSASIYGEPESVPIPESAPPHPSNPYGETKLAVEKMISHKANSRGLAAMSLRYFNVAGALNVDGGWIGERHNPETHVIPNVLKSTSEYPVQIFGSDWPTPDGTCIRDYVHVVDLVEAHLAALVKLNASTHKIVNLGSGRGHSVREILQTATEVVGRTIPHVEAPIRQGDPAILVADISRARVELGWSPTKDLRRIIEDTARSMDLI